MKQIIDGNILESKERAGYQNTRHQREVKVMKKIIVVILAVLFVSSVAYAKDYEVKKKAGNYNVEVKIDKNPPVVGDNNMKI